MPLYESLGDLVVVPEVGGEWGDGVMVGLSSEAVDALVGAKAILASESDLRIREGGTHTPTRSWLGSGRARWWTLTRTWMSIPSPPTVCL